MNKGDRFFLFILAVLMALGVVFGVQYTVRNAVWQGAEDWYNSKKENWKQACYSECDAEYPLNILNSNATEIIMSPNGKCNSACTERFK